MRSRRGQGLAEVYDHEQPATRAEMFSPVALPSWSGIDVTMVRLGDRHKNRASMRLHLRVFARDVPPAMAVEHDVATVWVPNITGH